MYIRGLCLFIFLFLSACSGVSVNEYQGREPTLDLRKFFDGQLKVYGILQDRGGKVTRKFTADIDASWEGDTGVLDETFYFDDGETSKRIWTLKDLGEGRFSGTAGDVVGEAYGEVRGFAFNWKYVLSIPYKNREIDVSLDDWLYLVTEDRLINKTELRKFGFRVGELTLIIERI